MLEKLFTEMVDGDGKSSCGLKETLEALKQGVVEYLICWEKLPVTRYVVRNTITSEVDVIHFTPKKHGAPEPSVHQIIETNKSIKNPREWEIAEQQPLVDWLAEHYREFGASLVFISGNSESGNQFVQSFGGISGILRYAINFELGGNDLDDEEQDDDMDDMDDGFTMDVSDYRMPQKAAKEDVFVLTEDDFEDDFASEPEKASGQPKEKKGKEKLQVPQQQLEP